MNVDKIGDGVEGGHRRPEAAQGEDVAAVQLDRAVGVRRITAKRFQQHPQNLAVIFAWGLFDLLSGAGQLPKKYK